MSTLDPRRRALLEVMGIPVWEARDGVAATPMAAAEEEAVARQPAAAVSLHVAETVRAAGDGVPPRRVAPDTARAIEVPAARAGEVAGLDWDSLAARVAGCTACELAAGRNRTVFGVGRRDAEWLVIGEAPGAEEDRRGEPFVGRAGQLLDAMLAALGLSRDAVYIANILKCRPPQNRDPRPEEVLACAGYLARQIALIRPRLILAVGRIAAQNLLRTEVPIGRLRGSVHRYGEAAIPVVVTYHPAYLLRSPAEKSKAWTDLLLARATLAAAPPR